MTENTLASFNTPLINRKKQSNKLFSVLLPAWDHQPIDCRNLRCIFYASFAASSHLTHTQTHTAQSWTLTSNIRLSWVCALVSQPGGELKHNLSFRRRESMLHHDKTSIFVCFTAIYHKHSMERQFFLFVFFVCLNECTLNERSAADICIWNLCDVGVFLLKSSSEWSINYCQISRLK